MRRHRSTPRTRATPEKQGEVFLAAHNAETPGTAVQADDPRLAAIGGGAHAADHENGGSDEIDVTGLSGELADPQPPKAHATSHQNGGSDEINVAGLSGLLADEQDPLDHATDHQAGGGDAIQLDNLAAPDDNTDLNASASAHGLMPKLNGASGTVMHYDGTWAYASAYPGAIIFGTGEDGSLTLVGDTALSAATGNIPIYQFTTVTLSTFTLTQAAGDRFFVIHCSVLLTSNGGVIFNTQQDTGVAGGAAGGGAGGGGRAAGITDPLWVFALITTGTGTIRSNGATGGSGGNATAATATANGANGGSPTGAITGMGQTFESSGTLTVGGGGNSNGTAGVAGGSTGTSTLGTGYRAPLPPFMSTIFNDNYTSGGDSPWYSYDYHCIKGGGGGAGGRNNGGAQAGGGAGSGSGSYSWFTAAAAGGAGGAGAAGGSGAGGGGGSVGGAGGFVCFVTTHCSAGWTLESKGGDGGNGGNGFDRGGGGGAGPGGPGGWAVAALGRLSNAVTIDVSGGTAGTPGTAGSLGGNPGNNGNNGNAGRGKQYTL